MAISLERRQTQRVAISPGMRLGLDLLALPIGELKSEIKRELETNPAIEVERLPRSSSRIPPAVDASTVENLPAAGESLEEHLLLEIDLSGMDARRAELARAIIADLDADGRFKGSIADIMTVTGSSADELEAARRAVMKLDPLGCGARDLKECFLSQIEAVPEKLRKRFESEVGRLETGRLSPEIIKTLKELDPFPGRRYERVRTDYVVPDVIVNARGEVRIDDGDVPELRVSPKYVEMAKDASLSSETREYAAERVKRAREFRAAVIRRRETLERAVEAIVEAQSEFVARGRSKLVRLTMSEIAKRVGCSVATISRAAARKCVRTPHGIVPLRDFFTTADPPSVEKLRELLVSIRDRESISDRELSDRLGASGFPMARRTVAKYRRKLGFSPKKA